MPPIVRSPDGREWMVRIHRLRLPAWRPSEYDPVDEPGEPLRWLTEPLQWFTTQLLVPLARALVGLPYWLVRSLVTSERDVTAQALWPNEMTIRWRTDRSHARAVADFVAARLVHGYEDLDPPNAEFVAMTRPQWLE
ncbi:MAG: hypothetical protein ACKVUT_14945 [Gaiella sp.]